MKANGHLSLRQEFHPSSLSLHSISPVFFTFSSLLRSRKLFLIYRFCIMIYSLVTIALSVRGFAFALPPKRMWPVWLTNWSYLVGTLHFVLSFFILLRSPSSHQNDHKTSIGIDSSKAASKSPKKERKLSKMDKPETQAKLPLLYRIDWVCFSIACTLSCFVTVVFFVALFPRKQLDFIPAGDAITHLFNSIIMLMDLLVADLPFRISHFLYVLLLSLSYFVFSVMHWIHDPPNNFLYKGMLDWNEPINTLKVGAFLCFILLPLLHLCVFLLFRLKSAICSKLPHPDKSDN